MGTVKGGSVYGFLLRIGCVCTLLMAFSGSFLGFPDTGFHHHSIESKQEPSQIRLSQPIKFTHKIVRQKIPAPFHPDATPPNEFSNTIDDLYWKLVSLLAGGKTEWPWQIRDLFKEHGKLDDKNVEEFYKEAKIDNLERSPQRTPACKASANLKIYEELLRSDPQNSTVQKRVAH
jgi:hypothetical protein